ncbi:MAG: Nif3-like dinuclear metal center hexameric protein [Rikenellaceae bacterium]|nr:Nif3-like dinuclear metal center hexameric protein [Rikenellaceae bacterium]
MQFTVSDIVRAIEQYAPPALQQPYDNSGLVVGRYGDTATKALLCVDVTDEVMDEAQATGADMVISHHPLIFHALKRLNGEGYVERLAERAIREGMALYACHTNLDAVYGGMSHKLARDLGLVDIEVLDKFDPLVATPTCDVPGPAGFGVTGSLPQPMNTVAFLGYMKERLRLDVIRHSALCRDTVCRVALCTGAGANLTGKAVRSGADIYIAADFRYNDFIDADGRIIVADIGHFESEYCAIDLLYDVITKKLPTFAVRKSVNSRNPVNYFK